MSLFAIGRLSIIISLAIAFSARAVDEFIVPVGASSPHVFLSLTDERDQTEGFFSIPASRTSAPGLPLDSDPFYKVVIYDTGSPTTIISRDTFEKFDIAGAGLSGTNITPVGGVGELVDAVNSDPLGVYAAGPDALLTNPVNGEQVVDRSRLRGSFNDPILYGTPGTSLPNVVGTNTAMNYVSVINYSEPKIIDFDGETYRSPNITLAELGSVAAPDRRIRLTLEPSQLGSTSGTFLPDLAGIADGGDIADNPGTPSIGGSFWLTANFENNGVQRNQLRAILDTGAQATIVSEQIAAELGFDVINDKPDFFVHIQGVTGVSEEVPGFYADQFHLPGTDGGLLLNDVPLIVFNLTDPRDGINQLDALIGMNVFAGRDVIINPELGSPYLGVSDANLPAHSWAATTPSARLMDPSSWSEPGVPALDWFATLRNASNEPRLAVVDEAAELGALTIGGNETDLSGTMTVSVTEGNKLTVFGTSIVQAGGVLDVDGGEIDTFGVELRGGSLSGSGVVRGEISSQGNVIPGGEGEVGSLQFPGNADLLNNSVLKIDLGDNSDPSNLQHDSISIEGQQLTLDGRLELFTTDDYVQPAPGSSDEFTLVRVEDRMIGAFEEYSFNGTELEREFPLVTDRRSFRDHVGDGQFITVSYFDPQAVSVRNEQALLGDANGDGEVQFDDFIAVAENFNMEADWSGGDFDGDGLVSFLDFLALAENFGAVAGGAAEALVAIPEPSAAMLTLLGGIALVRRTRR